MANQRIHILRKSLGLSQEQFGEKLGVSKTSISLLESNKTTLSRQLRLAILREFNVNPDWLDNGNEPMFNRITTNEQLMEFITDVAKSQDSDIRKQILLKLSKISPEQWDSIIEIFETLKKQWLNSLLFSTLLDAE